MNLRQARFVAAYVADPECNATRAAISAGYSHRNASNRAHELLRLPLVRDAVTAARNEIAERGNFDAMVAMRRLDDDRNFARATGNATAAVRATEMMLRLHGLLIDRAEIKVTPLDVGGTLMEARKRVAFSFNPLSQAAVPSEAEYSVIDPFS